VSALRISEYTVQDQLKAIYQKKQVSAAALNFPVEYSPTTTGCIDWAS
jgi:hypothetical protein